METLIYSSNFYFYHSTLQNMGRIFVPLALASSFMIREISSWGTGEMVYVLGACCACGRPKFIPWHHIWFHQHHQEWFLNAKPGVSSEQEQMWLQILKYWKLNSSLHRIYLILSKVIYHHVGMFSKWWSLLGIVLLL